MGEDKDNQYTLLLDIGATNTRIALLAPHERKIRDIKTIRTPQANLLDGLKEKICKFIGSKQIAQISISVAGPVTKGSVVFTNIDKHPVVSAKDFYDISENVSMINDASAAALAQAIELKCDNLIYVTLSSGIGVGIAKNGKVITSKVDQELGHLQIESSYNTVCGCGGHNHWESFCSGNNIVNFYNTWAAENKLKTIKHSSSFDLFEAAKADSPERKFIINEFGAINSKALDVLTARYSPDVIVLGGALSLNNRELIMTGLDLKTEEKPIVIFTSLGDEVCLLGALYYSLLGRRDS